MEADALAEAVRRADEALRQVLGRNLAYYRHRRDMKQLDLAHRLGYADHSMISMWERGHRRVPWPRLLQLGVLLGVPVAFFLWEPFPPPLPERGWPSI